MQTPEQAERAALELTKQQYRRLLEQVMKDNEPQLRQLVRTGQELTLSLHLEGSLKTVKTS